MVPWQAVELAQDARRHEMIQLRDEPD